MDGPDMGSETEGGRGFRSGESGGGAVGEEVWQYREHPEVAGWSDKYVKKLRTEVSTPQLSEMRTPSRDISSWPQLH